MARRMTTCIRRASLGLSIAVAVGACACSGTRADKATPASGAEVSHTTPSGQGSAHITAPQPGPAYALMLGPSSIDDGLAGVQNTSRAVTNALSAVTDAFGSGNSAKSSSSSSDAVSAATALDAAIPASEYDLVQLAKTLPDDPNALYRMVTDRIAVDSYDGVMRGPLVTWMSRAGGPTDKTALLAWLLVTKNIPYQFVRGSLSAVDRAQISKAAATPGPAAAPDPGVASYTTALSNEGDAFAQWAGGLLAQQHVQLGGNPPADLVSSRHYWIQIARNNAIVDLDPTIPGSAIGTHLGTIDTSFKPTAALPQEEWHYLNIRVTAAFADATTKTLLDHTDTVATLAYAPIRLVFAPSGAVDPMQPGSATAFDVGLQIGSNVSGRSHVELGNGATALQSVVLDVQRKRPDGSIVEVARRSLIDQHTPAADRPYRLAGMTTIIVAPGRGATAFATHTQFHALHQLTQDVAAARGGASPSPHPWYPIRIIDYFRRDDAMADALAAADGARLFRDRPNIAMLHTTFVRNGTGADVVTAFDIADNGMDSTSAERAIVVKENMVRGYADTRIEHDVLESSTDAGTIAVFAGAKSQSVAVSVLTQTPPAGDALHDGLDRTISAGQVAIAPSAPVTVNGRPLYGWWAIDLKSGNTVGRMTGGGGQDLAEESVTINTISRAYTLYGQAQTVATCAKAGFGSLGCMAAACASIASYVFGGGTAGALASNYVAGELATAGCNKGFGVK